jgi:hypothetical protein
MTNRISNKQDGNKTNKSHQKGGNTRRKKEDSSQGRGLLRGKDFGAEQGH